MVMTFKTRRRLLWATNAALAGLIALGLWVNLRPVQSIVAARQYADATTANRQGAAGPQGSAAAEYRPLAWYARSLDKPLRRPLYDPKPEPPKVVVVPPKPLHLELVGTIIEAGGSTAIVRTPKGETKFVRVGQVVDEARLKQVDSARAVFEFDGREVELTRDDKGAGR